MNVMIAYTDDYKKVNNYVQSAIIVAVTGPILIFNINYFT